MSFSGALCAESIVQIEGQIPNSAAAVQGIGVLRLRISFASRSNAALRMTARRGLGIVYKLHDCLGTASW
jgi:hypothetical protein